MQLTCPVCFARFALEAALNDEDARRAITRLATLGDDTLRLVVTYVGLFRPPKHVLAWRRAGRLIDEVVDIIESGTIHRRGRPRALTRAQFAEALEVVIERRNSGRLDLPLRTHAYLFEVAVGIADKAEGAAERATEEARRTGRRDGGGTPAGAGRDSATEYEALLDEARRLGVEYDDQGRVRRTSELYEAVRQARLQEAAS